MSNKSVEIKSRQFVPLTNLFDLHYSQNRNSNYINYINAQLTTLYGTHTHIVR